MVSEFEKVVARLSQALGVPDITRVRWGCQFIVLLLLWIKLSLIGTRCQLFVLGRPARSIISYCTRFWHRVAALTRGYRISNLIRMNWLSWMRMCESTLRFTIRPIWQFALAIATIVCLMGRPSLDLNTVSSHVLPCVLQSRLLIQFVLHNLCLLLGVHTVQFAWTVQILIVGFYLFRNVRAVRKFYLRLILHLFLSAYHILVVFDCLLIQHQIRWKSVELLALVTALPAISGLGALVVSILPSRVLSGSATRRFLILPFAALTELILEFYWSIPGCQTLKMHLRYWFECVPVLMMLLWACADLRRMLPLLQHCLLIAMAK